MVPGSNPGGPTPTAAESRTDLSDTFVRAPEALDPADLDIRTFAIVRRPWADTLDIRFAASHDGIVRRRADPTPISGPTTGRDIASRRSRSFFMRWSERLFASIHCRT